MSCKSVLSRGLCGIRLEVCTLSDGPVNAADIGVGLYASDLLRVDIGWRPCMAA